MIPAEDKRVFLRIADTLLWHIPGLAALGVFSAVAASKGGAYWLAPFAIGALLFGSLLFGLMSAYYRGGLDELQRWGRS